METLRNVLIYGVMFLVAITALLGTLLLLKNKKPTSGAPMDWFTDHLWIIIAVVGCVIAIPLVVWLWPAKSVSLKAPAPGAVWEFTGGYGLWFVALAIFAYLLTYLIKKEYEGLAKALRTIVVFVASVAFIGWIINGVWGEKTPASSPQSTWPRLVLPAGGRSESITVPPGTRMVAVGNNFLLHNVYPGGRECSFGQSCPDVSEVSGVYITNESKETNTILYSFKSIN